MVADTERGPIRTATIDAIDGAARDRVVGRILELSPPDGARAHAD